MISHYKLPHKFSVKASGSQEINIVCFVSTAPLNVLRSPGSNVKPNIEKSAPNLLNFLIKNYP